MYVPFDNSKLSLAFFYDRNANKVDSSNIVLIKNKMASIATSPIAGLATYYEKVLMIATSVNNFTGSINAYSITNKFKYDYGFINGKIDYHGFMAPAVRGHKTKTEKAKVNTLKPHSEPVKYNEADCQWWGHFTVYESGRTECEYIYLVCNNCDQSTSIGLKSEQQYIKSNCASDGGRALYPSVDPACGFSLEDAAKMIAGTTVEGSNEPAIFNSTASATTDPVTGIIREPFMIDQKVIKFSFSHAPNIVWYSVFYSGIRYKSSPTDLWKWEACDFVTSGQSSGVMPPCYEVQTTIGSTPHAVISNNNRTATISYLAYGVYKITCSLGFQQTSINIGNNVSWIPDYQ